MNVFSNSLTNTKHSRKLCAYMNTIDHLKFEYQRGCCCSVRFRYANTFYVNSMIILMTNPIARIVNAKVCKWYNRLFTGFRITISMHPISNAQNQSQLTISVIMRRREWDSNPRYACTYIGFQVIHRHLLPLVSISVYQV